VVSAEDRETPPLGRESADDDKSIGARQAIHGLIIGCQGPNL
jgi:hypothetical protein